MRSTPVLGSAFALLLMACADEGAPTQPIEPGPAAAAAAAAASNTWTARTPRPGQPLFGVSAAVAPNAAGHSIVYVFGGTDGEGGTGFQTSAYDATTDSWSVVPGTGCSSHGFDLNGVAKLGNRMYLSGGYTYAETKTTLISTFACDYAHGGLVQKANLPIFSAQGVTGEIDKKLYVLPGFCSGEVWPHPGYCDHETSRRFYRYDPVTNAWQARAQAPHSHRNGAGAVIDGKLYVAGGFRGEGGFTPVSDLDVYDPTSNTWKTLAPIPTPGIARGAALQGKFFVLTDGHAYVYTPSTNKWTTRATPQQTHDALVLVTIDGRARLLALGPESTELYTP